MPVNSIVPGLYKASLNASEPDFIFSMLIEKNADWIVAHAAERVSLYTADSV
jgi:hypothetical protein